MSTSHALKFNAAPYNDQGELIHPEDTHITRGPGRAKCTCGALSPELENGAERRRWFKEHKSNPVSWTEVSRTVTVTPVAGPEPEPEPQPEPEPEPEPETVDEELEVEHTVAQVLPFRKTKDLAAHFWRFLGRDGVRRLYSSGILGDVQVTTHAQDHTISVTGHNEDEVEAAVQIIRDYWAEAVETGKEWKKTDPGWLARPRGGLAMRQASFHLMGEYYRSYADTFIATRQDLL